MSSTRSKRNLERKDGDADVPPVTSAPKRGRAEKAGFAPLASAFVSVHGDGVNSGAGVVEDACAGDDAGKYNHGAGAVAGATVGVDEIAAAVAGAGSGANAEEMKAGAGASAGVVPLTKVALRRVAGAGVGAGAGPALGEALGSGAGAGAASRASAGEGAAVDSIMSAGAVITSGAVPLGKVAARRFAAAARLQPSGAGALTPSRPESTSTVGNEGQGAGQLAGVGVAVGASSETLGYAGIPGLSAPTLPPGVEIIKGGTVSEDDESLFFVLNDAYTAEMQRRANMVVLAGKASWGAPGFKGTREEGDIEASILGAISYRGLLRRKNAYVWQTRLMIERTSLNAGHFDHPLLAAVAYDFAQTFLRPGLRNANGTQISLNFAGTASDTRIVPVTTDLGLEQLYLEKPGVPIEEGHFWGKDEEYYKEIKLRAVGIERAGLIKEGEDDTVFVGIQKHKRKAGPGEDSATFTWEGKLIYRRKWFYLGRFKTQAEAAAAYDYGTTFLRPHHLKEDGARVVLNFPGAMSDCRVFPPIDPWPTDVLECIASGQVTLPEAPRQEGFDDEMFEANVAKFHAGLCAPSPSVVGASVSIGRGRGKGGRRASATGRRGTGARAPSGDGASRSSRGTPGKSRASRRALTPSRASVEEPLADFDDDMDDGAEEIDDGYGDAEDDDVIEDYLDDDNEEAAADVEFLHGEGGGAALAAEMRGGGAGSRAIASAALKSFAPPPRFRGAGTPAAGTNNSVAQGLDVLLMTAQGGSAREQVVEDGLASPRRTAAAEGLSAIMRSGGDRARELAARASEPDSAGARRVHPVRLRVPSPDTAGARASGPTIDIEAQVPSLLKSSPPSVLNTGAAIPASSIGAVTVTLTKTSSALGLDSIGAAATMTGSAAAVPVSFDAGGIHTVFGSYSPTGMLGTATAVGGGAAAAATVVSSGGRNNSKTGSGGRRDTAGPGSSESDRRRAALERGLARDDAAGALAALSRSEGASPSMLIGTSGSPDGRPVIDARELTRPQSGISPGPISGFLLGTELNTSGRSGDGGAPHTGAGGALALDTSAGKSDGGLDSSRLSDPVGLSSPPVWPSLTPGPPVGLARPRLSNPAGSGFAESPKRFGEGGGPLT